MNPYLLLGVLCVGLVFWHRRKLGEIRDVSHLRQLEDKSYHEQMLVACSAGALVAVLLAASWEIQNAP